MSECTYVPASPCGRCGTSERYQTSGNCVQCRKVFDQNRVRDQHAERTVEQNRGYQKTFREKIKRQAFAAYGGPACVGCGESCPEVLSIDHIGGGGGDHRRAINSQGGANFYAWLKRNGYPPGYRVLCMNCQWKSHRGIKLPREGQ